MVTGARPGDRENGFGRSRLQLARRQFDLRLGLRRSRDGRLILVRLLRGAIPNDPVPDREKRRLADPARSRRMVAVDHKGIERAEEQSWQVTAARSQILDVATDDISQLFEHEAGDGGVLPALDRTLEFPHQQRLRLYRKLREIFP